MMKKTISLLTLALLSCATSMAQKIQVANDAVNIGQVQYFVPASAVFELKNSGNRPLVISRIETNCGCTVASLPSTPIGAGDRFTINVTYDARMMGHFNKYIEVYSNASDSPLMLYMSGVVVEEVKDFIGNFPFKLGNLTADCNEIFFEDVRLGERIQQKFHIFNPTDRTVQPQVMHLPAYLKAEVSPSNVAPKRSAEITITLDSRFIRDYGLESTHIYLGSNPGEKVSSSKRIDVSAIFLPAVQSLTEAEKAIAPSMRISDTVVEMSIADGKKKSQVVTIENVGKSRLDINRLQMMTEGLQVELNKTSLAPGETARLKISTNPRQLRNLKDMPRVMMITNDPERPKVVVDVHIK